MGATATLRIDIDACKRLWRMKEVGTNIRENMSLKVQLIENRGENLWNCSNCHLSEIPMKKSLVRTRCAELWRDEFANAAEKKGSPSHVPWWMGVQISPCLLKALFRLQSGHISINGFYYLMGKAESPNCSECYRIEDAHHLL